MYWDEDNRLMVLSDNGKTCRYTYNAGGERIIKSHGDLEGVYINGAPQGITFHETEDYTIYPAPMITVTKNRFTKHYFIGDKRVASKLGVGKFSNVYGISGNNVTAGQKDYAARMMQIEKQREEYYKSRETPPGVPTMKGATADPDNTHRGYNDIIGDLGDHSVPEGWVQRPKFNEKGDVPGPPVQWQKPEDPDNAQPGYGYVPTDTTNTEDIFFYHSDHLGSTSYITDKDANITQFDAYLPYGELLVDEHSSSEDMPYKFNGKELDEETGLYYYGARYMDPKISMWLGVDPLAEKNVSTSPFAFCNGNPINYLDLDGLDTIKVNFNLEQDKWIIESVTLAKGHDVYQVTKDGETETSYFASTEDGDVTFLSLDITNGPTKKDSYALGVYHIHGSDEKGATGYFVAPGGKPSSKKGSNSRVPDGAYPMTTPNYYSGRWRLPGLGGIVAARGIRIHFGSKIARRWSTGCFIISSDYEKRDNHIYFDGNASRRQVILFNKILGASEISYYKDPNRKYMPLRAKYKKPLTNTVFVGTR